MKKVNVNIVSKNTTVVMGLEDFVTGHAPPGFLQRTKEKKLIKKFQKR